MVVTQESVAVNGSRRSSPQEIADVLRERIKAGELRAGERLPTQAELAEEFGVERGAVRQALRSLQEDGLLSNVSKGSPPRIAEQAPARHEPQRTMVGLAPRLSEAFASPQVRIDAVCLTAETLMLALGEPLRYIHEGRIRPDSVDVRILLPGRDINLAFPVSATEEGDAALVHKRWLDQRNAQGQVLRHNLRSLRSSHGIDVRVTFRALPFTPPVKLYLLNGNEALLSYYLVTRREEEIESGTLDMYDTLGTESLLFSFEKRAGQRDTAFVEESQKWFDALWETITTDLTLS
ncbi:MULTISPECIES: GntR family transcriptional regulator [unclassified Streptomyces]|uniref:GntR family transcriptional regulator n=1 Tax=unclassified Streptomyces TaxID=2593676 RepID=UPI0022576A96|nr:MULTISPECIES: GntR family transcriptional regulator [unclassified Streptomyces]MCX5438169.1 GntR family transcriptional regulator [Streptomyces sp. NBC_00063]WSE15817.1 GntR family transcriptional regulator [Streptomyces sp. NBC_01397]WUB95276.1 GntR family transcriptional regulator [Streptomyces sp. NBC_00569]